MCFTKETLLFDLYKAYYDACKNKNKKDYIIDYNKNLHNNLVQLRDDLFNRTYKALPSTCFIIRDPKQREVFAADFRDRIVHHLYFNYTREVFESLFIYDSYSCIKNKGTHFGINRLEHHILSESNCYTKDCFVLKLDIQGYFMHIDRNLLLLETLRIIDCKLNYSKELIDFIKYLSKEIILLDPTVDCIIKGNKSDWIGLPKSKTLFGGEPGLGLPIGNLTSLLFSNVYMNKFDLLMKRDMKCKHYGRYVDDAYIVSSDRLFLLDLIPKVEKFLKEELHLTLHRGKTRIYNVKYGIEFLGAFLKPYRRYVSNQCLRRMKKKMTQKVPKYKEIQSNISRVGILSHYKSKNIIKSFLFNDKLLNNGSSVLDR